MALSYTMVVMSVPGGAVEGMLDHLRTWAEGWWRIVGGLLAGGWLVFHAWRFVTFVELLTNEPAVWRSKSNPSIGRSTASRPGRRRAAGGMLNGSCW